MDTRLDIPDELCAQQKNNGGHRVIEYSAQGSTSLPASIAGVILRWWEKRGETILRIATALMAIAGGSWLGYEFWRLLILSHFWGGFDLRVIQAHVQQFSSGILIYHESRGALYPPASYLMLLPLIGWIDFATARLLWGLLMVIGLVALASVALRASGANTASERSFISLMPLSMYAAGATVGNGQLIVLILPLLLTALLLLRRAGSDWRIDLLITALFLFALVKPNVSAPFFWILLFAHRGWRLALVVALGYIALTLIAAFYQPVGLVELVQTMMTLQASVASRLGSMNLHIVLSVLGLGGWMFPASMIILLALGLWIYANNRADIWILMSVAAICARLWTYHWWFDDLLILVPMIALFRIAKRGGLDEWRALAGILLAVLVPAMIAPGTWYLIPSPVGLIFQVTQAVLWIAALMFLIAYAWREKNRSSLAIA